MKGFNSNAICFFDSGIGGLTLLAECMRQLPEERFVYFADNYNVPYGSKPREKLIEITDAVFSEIAKRKPAAAVLGCNTVTAQCAEYLRAKYPFPIIGIQPAVKPAAAFGKNCVVLSTPSTAQSKSMAGLVALYGRGVTKVVACPNLAAYIEENIFCLSEEKLASLLPDIEPDAVVLGCTHYVYIKEYVKKRYKCAVFDGNSGTAKHLCEVLGKTDHFCAKNGTNATASPPRLRKMFENVEFSGGNEGKNRLVLSSLLLGCGE